MTIRDLIARDALALAQALNLDPAEAKPEIRVLLGYVLGVNRAWLITHEQDLLDPAAMAAYQALLKRRLNGEPVAYLLGEKEFFGRMFQVAPGVLVPRPETELLVELAREKIATCNTPRVLDLGTGSGCIAITLALECPHCRVMASDRSEAALNIARDNATQHNAPVEFYAGDWFDALPGSTEKFDLILSNPPYIESADPHLTALRHEPLTALAAGEDGLDDLRRIVQGAAPHLVPGGWLMLEHGWNQADAVQTLLKAQGFQHVETRNDLAGIGRVSLGKMA